MQAEANRRRQHKVENFLREWAANNSPYPEGDTEGIRAQRFDLNSTSNPSAYLAGDSVYFPIEVAYEPMSEFASKTYHDQFAAAFSFAEMQPYLRASSPFRRLATPPVTKAAAPKR